MFTSVVSPGYRHAGQRDTQESSASQCALVTLWVSLLLLHPGLLHVAGGLPQQEGEAIIIITVRSSLDF